MSKSIGLEQHTRMQQRLNPRQVVFGRYLEMTAPEFEEEVRRVIDENPALAVSDATASDHDGGSDSDNSFDESPEQLQLADYGSEDDIPVYNLEKSDKSTRDFYPQDFLSSADDSSLVEVMTAQLADIDLSEKERKIAEYIIGNLDANGYMTRSLPDIAEDMAIAEGIDTDMAEIKAVFAQIRHLDPAGIAAVDLRDCLLLQIDRQPASRITSVAREIIADCFDLFSKKHYDKLRSQLGIDDDELRDALDYIRTLNPKPGSLIEGNSVNDRLRHIIPDFAVEVDSDGHATVSLLNYVPELAIEESFRIDDLPPASNKRDADAMSFIRRRHDDAVAFISLLKMRADTLMTVMKAIVKIQSRFFTLGDTSTIRPMIIKDIADITGLNISVISRATAGKYVLTNQGVYPLKMFFNERPKDDVDTSSHEILAALSEIIKTEDKSRPMSDDALCKVLAGKGYDIARRTVTKYRERLGLPVARLRKQFKKNDTK